MLCPIAGVLGGTYTIEYTTNLSEPREWFPAATLLLSNTVQIWVDLESPRSASRYYRAVSE